jgi:DNA-directed RNA polymerase specialized sigma subunit
MTIPISEEEAQQALEFIRILALKQWVTDHYSIGLAEYHDVGMAALSGCLERYDPQLNPSFARYAKIRIRGAMQDARKPYHTWRYGAWRGRTYPAPWVDVLRPHEPQPTDTLFTAWLHQQARTLPPIQRAILTALLAGETRAEIARARGVTEGAVLRCYRNLLASLRQRLQQRDDPAAAPH